MSKTIAILMLCAAAVHADDASRISDLEKRLSDLDQKYRALEKRVGEDQPAKKAPTVSLGAGGLSFQSADTNFVFKVHGLLQVDSRWYFGSGPNDTLAMRRVRPFVLEGTFYRDFSFLFTPEFGNGRAAGGTATATVPSILDAYINYQFMPWLQVRAGKMKEPVGLEELQSDAYIFMIERGLVNDLMPNRDVGIQIHGDVAEGLMTYQTGVFNGVADGANSGNIDFDDQKDLAARLFFQPFIHSSAKAARGFGIGIGASYGSREGIGAIGSHQTETLAPLFAYGTTVVGNGIHYRWTPQLSYYYGPFGLIAEYAVSSQEVAAPAAQATLDHRAWQVALGYVLTGEDSNPKGVTPKHPFSLASGDWGAFELTARYSHIDFDNDAFPTFASAAASATDADAFTGGLNWHLSRNFKTAVNYVHTTFKGGAAGGDRQDEDSILTRFQLVY